MSVRPRASVFVVVILALSASTARAQDASCVAQVEQYRSDWKAFGDEAARQGVNIGVGDAVDRALGEALTMTRTAMVDIRRLSAAQLARHRATIDAATDALRPFNQALKELIECGAARVLGQSNNCLAEFESTMRASKAGFDIARQWLQGLDNTGTLGAIESARSFSTVANKVIGGGTTLATNTISAGANCINQLQQRLQAEAPAVDTRQPPPSQGQGAGAPRSGGGGKLPILGGLALAGSLVALAMPQEMLEDTSSTGTGSTTTSSNPTTTPAASGVSSFNGTYDLYYELFDVASLARRGFTLPGYIRITDGRIAGTDITGTVDANGNVTMNGPCHDGGPTVVPFRGSRTGTNVFEGTYTCVRITYPWRIFNRR